MPRLLLAGAGHAHMAVMAAIPELVAKAHQVTAIGPGDRHYYSGMGPGMLGLQSLSHPDIFGGGDCITFTPGTLDKVGVYAVRQNPVLLHNLQAQLEGRSLKVFDPGGSLPADLQHRHRTWHPAQKRHRLRRACCFLGQGFH